MTRDISDAPDPFLQSPSKLQYRFFSALHPDIILSIMSYLDQQDCLTCMAVCRSWYDIIPEYAQSAWTAIRLSAHKKQMENKRWVRCLGTHVKQLVLDKYSDEQHLYHTMHELLDYGCTEIKHLELNECKTSDQDEFLDALTKLGSHLTQLKLLCHDSNIAFLHVFNACPELTHFTFHVGTTAWWRYNVYNQEPVIDRKQEISFSDLRTKITHLCLNTDLHKESRIYPVLKSCPDLRSFVGPSKWTIQLDYATQDWQYNDVAIDLDILFGYCPKVNYVRSFFTYSGLEVSEDINAYTNDPSCLGLRYLDICEDYGCDRIAQCLSTNQDTIEYLSIGPYTFYDGTSVGYWWSPVFESLQLPHLTTLISIGSMADEIYPLVDLINRCPAVEKLVLGYNSLTFDHEAVHSLSTLHQLLSLDLNQFTVDYFGFTEILTRFPVLQELTLTYASVPIDLARHLHHVNQLKHFSMAHVTWISDDNSGDDNSEINDKTTARFFQGLAADSQLETIRVAHIPYFGVDSLLAIAGLPSLKTCDIALPVPFTWDDNLHKFALMLQGTAIERLKLRMTGYVPYDALTAFGDLPLLKELYLSSSTYYLTSCKVDRPGLLQLLRTTKSLTNIYFGRVIVAKSKNEETDYSKDLPVLINQVAPWYRLEEINMPELYRPSELDVKYYSTVIKRRVNQQ